MCTRSASLSNPATDLGKEGDRSSVTTGWQRTHGKHSGRLLGMPFFSGGPVLHHRDPQNKATGGPQPLPLVAATCNGHNPWVLECCPGEAWRLSKNIKEYRIQSKCWSKSLSWPFFTTSHLLRGCFSPTVFHVPHLSTPDGFHHTLLLCPPTEMRYSLPVLSPEGGGLASALAVCFKALLPSWEIRSASLPPAVQTVSVWWQTFQIWPDREKILLMIREGNLTGLLPIARRRKDESPYRLFLPGLTFHR